MTQRMPKVSVVVAAYNGAGFIAETLESLLHQEYDGEVEVIVCDDGSKDETPEILRGFGDRITFISQKNAGVSEARNQGAKHATGELIGFIDQDDQWEPQLLRTLVPMLLDHPHWGLVYADSWIIDAKGEKRGRRRTYLEYEEGWIFTRLLSGNFIPIETSIIRRELFERVGGFDRSLRYLEDFEINLRLSRLVPFGFHPEPLARYRIHGDNLSHDIEALLEEWARVLETLQRDATTLTTTERRTLEREIRLRFGELAWHAVRRGDMDGADEWLERAGKAIRPSLKWKVRVPRAVLGALPEPVSQRLLGLLPRRKLYGVDRPS